MDGASKNDNYGADYGNNCWRCTFARNNTENRQTFTEFQASSLALLQEGDESHASQQEPILRMSTFHCMGLAWTRCRMSYDS